jgi:hypothetical protein
MLTAPATDQSFLSTRRGQLSLALVCLAGFLDSTDTTIINVALRRYPRSGRLIGVSRSCSWSRPLGLGCRFERPLPFGTMGAQSTTKTRRYDTDGTSKR